MRNADRTAPASLWIGQSLSYLDLLCLKSFSDIGQPVTLYTYEPVNNIPDYVIHADAREVFDPPEILRQRAGRKHLIGSPAIHSDIFRIRLLTQTDKFWVDTDAYALRPLIAKDGYLFSKVGGNYLSGVLSLPSNSNALCALQNFMSQPGEIPPWWDEDKKNKFLKTGFPLDFRYMEWGTLGPWALRHFLLETGEASKASAPEVLYPIRPRERHLFTQPECIVFGESTVSIHLFASNLRALLKSEHHGLPPAGSLIHNLCEKHSVDPHSAPL